MDTEEAREIEEHRKAGKSPTDEGPYYHESWWESYKGGVKGLLGGLAIGGGLGAAAGTVIAAGLLVAGVPLTGGMLPVIGAVAAFGMIEGAHKFSQVGVVTGAVAAAHEKSEARLKEFEGGKFAELKRDIASIKAALTGKAQPEEMPASAKAELTAAPAGEHAATGEYRTTHCDEHCPPGKRKLMFWNVAAIGATAGAAAGALLGVTGGEHIVSHVIGHSVELAPAALTMTGIGATLGASFGVNRDVFRGVFDVTDRLFKGILPGKDKAPEPALSPAITLAKAPETPDAPQFLQPAPEPAQALEPPSTYFQDKVGSLTARQALLSFEHTTAVRH